MSNVISIQQWKTEQANRPGDGYNDGYGDRLFPVGEFPGITSAIERQLRRKWEAWARKVAS